MNSGRWCRYDVFGHGCSGAQTADVSEAAVNQPEKGDLRKATRRCCRSRFFLVACMKLAVGLCISTVFRKIKFRVFVPHSETNPSMQPRGRFD